MIKIMKKQMIAMLTLVAFGAILFADAPDWEVDIPAYEHNATQTGLITFDGVESVDTLDLVGAFVGGECRGVASPSFFPVTGRYTVNMMIYSNASTGETMTFKAYDASADVVFEELFDIDSNIYAYDFLAHENVGNDITPVEWFAVTPIEAITADFSADVTEGAEVPLTVTFTDLSVIAEGEIISWAWDFGDGETSIEQNPVHDFATAGYFTVALTVGDGVDEDTETKVDYIHINEAPVLIDIEDQTINEDEFVQIILEATDDGGALTFGATSDEVDVAVSINNDHLLLTPAANWFGTALITITVTDDFGATDTDDFTLTVVSVDDAPVADFTADVTEGIGSLEVTFTDLSTDVDNAIVAYDWTFGDDGTSTDQNPIHFYEMAGNYTVTLTVTDETGLMDTEEKVDYIVIVPPEELFPPRNLNAEVVDINDVNLTWSAPNTGGEGDEIEEGFEAGALPEGWEAIDNDGDGFNWQISPEEWTTHNGSAHCITSASYDNTAGVLYPDNWLISPALTLGGAEELRFWTAAQDPNWAGEVYFVKISTTDSNIGSFTDQIFTETLSSDTYHEVVLDLSAFAGETVYIAWQHAEISDMFWLNLDDISVLNRNTREVVFSADFEDVGDFVKMTKKSSGTRKYERTNREFLGEYNVYRDGVQLNVDPITETNFDEYDLEVGTYSYTVTALYTGGYESEPTEPAEAIILGTGTITGLVTDALDNAPIEGALITAGEFEILTDTEGSYVLEVIEGTYDVTCSAMGYADLTETITIANEEVLTLDFVMEEVPYAPTVVEAVVNEEDTEATIIWSMNAEPVGECAGSYTVFGIADLDEDGVDDPCWSDGTGYFYFYWEGGCLATYIEYSAGGMDISSYGFTEGFFFYGFEPGVTETFAMTFDNGDVATETATNACGSRDEGQYISDLKYRRYNHFEDASYLPNEDFVYETPNLRTLDGYNVYLLLEDDESNEANWITVAESVVDTSYIDATWADIESGMYEYAVKAVYSSGTLSDPTFSNVLPKDMTVEVTVNVFLNSAESPAGADITLVGDEYTYTATSGVDGAVFDEVWKGTYDLFVEFSGFEDYEQTGVDIQDATTLDAVLVEIIEAPENLVVSVDAPNVNLSWDEAGSSALLTIEILTDDYGYETTWDLVDSDGNVIDSEMGGDFADATLYTWEYELEAGTYVWTIYDEWGDGICCDYGEGYYNLYLNGDNFASGGVFGASESIEFDTDGGGGNPEGYFDCDGVEFNEDYLSWLGDGYCDDGTYNINFLCDEWGWDCGDCPEFQDMPDPNGWCDGREMTTNTPEKDSFVPVTRSLEGYVIYVDGEEVDVVTDVAYTWVATNGGTYDFCVGARYTTGESSLICEEGVEVPFGDVNDNLHPITFDLHQNFPNPFNPVTSIGYDIPEACEVQISIYNVLGQQVKTLVNEAHQPGYYSVQWDGTNSAGTVLPNGLYIYTIDAGNFSSVKKLVLMK